MKTAIPIISILVIAVAVGFAASTDTVEHVPAVEVSAPLSRPLPAIVPPQKKPLVQMAILLDTSGSMSGLIEQAKTELWSIVNEFLFAEKNGMKPDLQLALYMYGNDGVGSENGYIRQILPLTTDLDKVSEELFKLKTNGSKEYCGMVIQKATQSLAWSNSFDDLKVIFIAGNEPFTQGSVDYKIACKEAITRGIIVNTIHCGSESDGLAGNWKDGAVLADGSFINIEQNRQVARSTITAPQDKEIAELNRKLNDTYIAYGRAGQEGQLRQSTQDDNAASISSEVAVGRAAAKASFNYRNSSWDLVDALKEEAVKLEEIKAEDLPENMRSMTIAERQAYVDAKAAQRTEIQKRIQELNVQRELYVKAEMDKIAASPNQNGLAGVGGRASFGSGMGGAIRSQGARGGFSFGGAP